MPMMDRVAGLQGRHVLNVDHLVTKEMVNFKIIVDARKHQLTVGLPDF
jgi:hypothetical protein